MTLNLAHLDGTNGFRLDGVASGDESGASVSGAGDVNGDGIADIVVGSYVVFGTTAGFTESVELAELDGTDGFRLGGQLYGVAGAGDVNGDGFDDLIAVDPFADHAAEDAGASYVVFGFDPAASPEATVGDLAAVPARGAATGGDEDFNFRASGREHGERADRSYPWTLARSDTWSTAVDPGPKDTLGRHDRAELAPDPDSDGIGQDAFAPILDLV